MSYLIVDFSRHHSEIWKDQNSLNDVKIVSQINREHLLSAKNDTSYQVINLETYEYFDPEKNVWVKIKRE